MARKRFRLTAKTQREMQQNLEKIVFEKIADKKDEISEEINAAVREVIRERIYRSPLAASNPYENTEALYKSIYTSYSFDNNTHIFTTQQKKPNKPKRAHYSHFGTGSEQMYNVPFYLEKGNNPTGNKNPIVSYPGRPWIDEARKEALSAARAAIKKILSE